MYVTLDEFRSSWNQIKRESLSHSTCRIVVLVSCLDVDALCAAKILDILLQKDLIPHKIVPVVGYESLKQSFLQLDADIKNVICVGCGANVDLDEFLGLDGEEGSEVTHPKIHIMDSHRPWNLNNMFGSDFVICYDDGYFDQLRCYKEAYEYLATHDDDDDDDAYDDDKIDHARDASDDGQSDDGQNESQEGATQEDKVQRPTGSIANTSNGRKRARPIRLEYERLLEEYYTHGSHIMSTDTVQVYSLLTMIGETSLRSLWLTIVGATSAEPQNPGLYSALHPPLRDEIRRLTRARDARSTRTLGHSKRDISFSTETDFSLFLLRQWSLYESMIHSSYLSAKLYLWKEDGRKTLHKMLARIGITLHDAKESWVHMKPHLKRELKQKLDSVSAIYGIEGICRSGVVRWFGLDGAISAGDCAEAIAALLEAGDGNRQLGVIPNIQTEVEGSSELDSGRQFWVENFWVAWDALENYQRLCAGAEQAKALQRAVVATGTAIFEKSVPKDLHSYRMVVVREGPDLVTFRNPLSLARLGVWIAEGCAELHARTLPLVLATQDEPRGTYLVLGMGPHKPRDDAGADPSTTTTYNQFGNAFQQTAARINARVRIDAFESSIIEVAKDDLLRFLQALDAELRTDMELYPQPRI